MALIQEIISLKALGPNNSPFEVMKELIDSPVNKPLLVMKSIDEMFEKNEPLSLSPGG